MFTPKHILILTADAGFGHRAAANAVAQALATALSRRVPGDSGQPASGR